MNNRISALMFATAVSCLSLGCSQINTSFSDQTPETPQDNQSANLQWLIYADPKADANFAIEKQDFTLLAFAGRVTSFPGIESDSVTLQQQCGYRILADSSDTLRSESELSLRNQLFQYAAAYNQLVAAACRKYTMNGDN